MFCSDRGIFNNDRHCNQFHRYDKNKLLYFESLSETDKKFQNSILSRKYIDVLKDAPEFVMDDASNCCSGPKLQYLVRKFKTDRKTIYGSRPSGFLYDPPSYELNFDHGHRREEDYQVQSLSLSAVKTGKVQ